MTTKPTENETELREKILEIIKGFEPIGHLDGTPEQNVIPSGYDLLKDERTEFGFYWEYEDMEKCADKLVALITSDKQRLLEGLMEELPNTRTIANPDAHEQGWSKHEAQPFNDCLHRVNSVIQNKLEGLS